MGSTLEGMMLLGGAFVVIVLFIGLYVWRRGRPDRAAFRAMTDGFGDTEELDDLPTRFEPGIDAPLWCPLPSAVDALPPGPEQAWARRLVDLEQQLDHEYRQPSPSGVRLSLLHRLLVRHRQRSKFQPSSMPSQET